jgi:hypothetical protein
MENDQAYTVDHFKTFILDNLPREHSDNVALPQKWDEWKDELLVWFEEVGIRVIRLQETKKI